MVKRGLYAVMLGLIGMVFHAWVATLIFPPDSFLRTTIGTFNEWGHGFGQFVLGGNQVFPSFEELVIRQAAWFGLRLIFFIIITQMASTVLCLRYPGFSLAGAIRFPTVYTMLMFAVVLTVVFAAKMTQSEYTIGGSQQLEQAVGWVFYYGSMSLPVVYGFLFSMIGRVALVAPAGATGNAATADKGDAWLLGTVLWVLGFEGDDPDTAEGKETISGKVPEADGPVVVE